MGTSQLNGQSVASFQTNALKTGTHIVLAWYSGDAKFSSAEASIGETVTTTTVKSAELDPGNLFDNPTLKVYPNPATDILKVEIGDWDGEVLIRLLNMQGSTVRLLNPVAPVRGSNRFEIRVEGLAKGIYLIDTDFGGKYRKTEKIIIGS